MAEEPTKTSTTEPAAKPKAKKEPILSFTGPEGATRVVTLLAALAIILQGNNAFWNLGIAATDPLNVFCGVMLYIIGVLIILMIGIIEFSIKYLEKIEVLEKFYRFEALLVLAALTLLFESLSRLSLLQAGSYTRFISSLLGGLLLLIAAILEIIKEKDIKPSKFMCLCGCAYAVFEAIMLYLPPITLATYWDASIAIVIVAILLLSIFKVIKFIPYEWWMVLILGFILWGWVAPVGSVSGGGVGGTLVLISFILMLLEE